MAIYENTNLKEDYVSFETAKLLKEKGFDVECIGCYYKGELNVFDLPANYNMGNSGNTLSAPTLQMAMKWLREVHKIHISVEMGFDVDNSQYFFYVPSVCRFSNKSGEYQTPFGEKEFGSYEEACEASIVYCLENLI